jgi:hypothetical protein
MKRIAGLSGARRVGDGSGDVGVLDEDDGATEGAGARPFAVPGTASSVGRCGSAGAPSEYDLRRCAAPGVGGGLATSSYVGGGTNDARLGAFGDPPPPPSPDESSTAWRSSA